MKYIETHTDAQLIRLVLKHTLHPRTKQPDSVPSAIYQLLSTK
jgi:hypothetical protein